MPLLFRRSAGAIVVENGCRAFMRGASLLLTLLLLILLLPTVLLETAAVQAAPYITLGPSDGFALDQPRVAVAVIDANAPGGPRNFGPGLFNEFLLDTGSSSMLVAGLAFEELDAEGYQVVAQYNELGIAGVGLMDVSAAYEFNFAGTDGNPFAIDEDIRLMSTQQTQSFGSYMGIVGMPAMIERTTSLDMTVWSGGNVELMVTSFSHAPPSPAGDRFQIPLTLKHFPQNGQILPTDPLPSAAPLPMIPVEMRMPGHTVPGQFVFDTGAQLSVISTATAAALGLDADGDGNFDNEALDFIEVQGISGSVFMPVLAAGSLSVRSLDGTKLVWTDMTVGVLDIDPDIPGEPPIDGIFGSDLLTSGWFEALFGGPDGYFNQVHLDFRDSANLNGTMLMDLNPLRNIVWYEGDVNGDGTVSIFDVNLVASNWGHLGGSGDANGDGLVNIFDINLVSADWTVSGAGATAVPEPAGLTLIAMALAIAAGLGICRRVLRRTVT